jgi:putative phosphoribosyl transferase
VMIGIARNGMPQTDPSQTFTGPMVTLINEFSASDGDIFPYRFKSLGLGKLIGKRTWGGVTGIRESLPLDVFIVRKLGVPGFEELAAGAIASGGVRVLNEDVVRAIPYATEAIEAVTAKETAELQRREQIYREGRPAPELRDKIAILVDDGLATGATIRAAVKALRQQGAAKIVVGVPVGPPDTCEELAQEADETICLSTPPFFQAVGQYYDDFSQTSDDDVRELLTRAALAGEARD